MLKGALHIGLVFTFLCISMQLSAQTVMVKTDDAENEVQKYTVMEKFEPKLVIPADERMRLKEERKKLIAHRRNILDTLSINDRRRQRLLRELNRNPFSDRINRTFAEIEFDDDKDIVEQNH